MIIVSGFPYNFEKKLTFTITQGGPKLTKDLLFDYTINYQRIILYISSWMQLNWKSSFKCI